MTESWRDTILRAALEEGEVHVDSLHEAAHSSDEGETEAEQDAAEQAMYGALEALERDGLVTDDRGTVRLTPAGRDRAREGAEDS